MSTYELFIMTFCGSWTSAPNREIENTAEYANTAKSCLSQMLDSKLEAEQEDDWWTDA